MRLIIAGSRSVLLSLDQITVALKDKLDISPADVTEVISGTARGADRTGELWAHDNDKPVRLMPADWNLHGKIAGKVRNADMARIADVACVFWDGFSNGSTDMVTRMVEIGKPVAVVICERSPEEL